MHTIAQSLKQLFLLAALSDAKEKQRLEVRNSGEALPLERGRQAKRNDVFIIGGVWTLGKFGGNSALQGIHAGVA